MNLSDAFKRLLGKPQGTGAQDSSDAITATRVNLEAMKQSQEPLKEKLKEDYFPISGLMRQRERGNKHHG